MTILNIQDKDFQTEVVNKSRETLVLVDFWAPWCAPCKMIAPVLEELSDEMKEKVTIIKMNVDETPENASQFSIRSIPTMILFKNEIEVERMIGAIGKEEIKKTILKHS